MNRKCLLCLMTILMVTMFSVCSCSNKNASSNSEGQAIAEAEVQDEPESEPEPEPELIETSFSFKTPQDLSGSGLYDSVKDIIRKKEPDRHGWEFDPMSMLLFTIKMNYDDGSASAVSVRQISVKDSSGDFIVECDSVYYDGFWKSRSVQRGNKYIDAYEFQLSKNVEKTKGSDSHQEWLLNCYVNQISLYTTEKLDDAYVGWGEDEDVMAFHNFHDGIKSKSLEIFDIKHTWK